MTGDETTEAQPSSESNDVPNELTERVLQESEEGKNLSRTYDSIGELMASLHS